MIISPDKGKLVERRGRKATGLRPGGVLATIAGLPKRRDCLSVPAHVATREQVSFYKVSSAGRIGDIGSANHGLRGLA
jgi:hypothetical protein